MAARRCLALAVFVSLLCQGALERAKHDAGLQLEGDSEVVPNGPRTVQVATAPLGGVAGAMVTVKGSPLSGLAGKTPGGRGGGRQSNLLRQKLPRAGSGAFRPKPLEMAGRGQATEALSNLFAGLAPGSDDSEHQLPQKPQPGEMLSLKRSSWHADVVKLIKGFVDRGKTNKKLVEHLTAQVDEKALANPEQALSTIAKIGWEFFVVLALEDGVKDMFDLVLHGTECGRLLTAIASSFLPSWTTPILTVAREAGVLQPTFDPEQLMQESLQEFEMHMLEKLQPSLNTFEEACESPENWKELMQNTFDLQDGLTMEASYSAGQVLKQSCDVVSSMVQSGLKGAVKKVAFNSQALGSSRIAADGNALDLLSKLREAIRHAQSGELSVNEVMNVALELGGDLFSQLVEDGDICKEDMDDMVEEYHPPEEMSY